MTPDRRMILGGGAAAILAALPGARSSAADVVRPIISSIAVDGDRVWIAAKVNDHGPYYFIVDTGAFVSLIDESLAKSLRMDKVGQSEMIGIGGVSTKPYYAAKTVVLGNGVRFPQMLFAGTDKILGKDAVGSFGAGMFTSYDSDLDFAKGEWRVYPAGRPDRAGLHRLASRFEKGMGGHSITVDASAGDFAGRFLVDTGSPGTMSLDGDASRRSGLWNDDRPYAPYRSRGIGRGVVPGRLVRLKRVKVGPFVFENPIVGLHRPGTPHMRNDGIIGLAALQRLMLSTDVRNQTLWAAPGGLDVVPDDYPMSGLLIDDANGAIVVTEVGYGSPAKAAGVMAGDRIMGSAMAPLLATLRRKAGSPVHLTIERDGVRKEVAFGLEDYL